MISARGPLGARGRAPFVAHAPCRARFVECAQFSVPPLRGRSLRWLQLRGPARGTQLLGMHLTCGPPGGRRKPFGSFLNRGGENSSVAFYIGEAKSLR